MYFYLNIFAKLLHQLLSLNHYCNFFLPFLRNANDLTDAYVVVKLDEQQVGRTTVIGDNLNPTWDERLRTTLYHKANKLTFHVFDHDIIGQDKFIGSVEFDTKRLLEEKEISGLFDILNGEANKGQVQLSINFNTQKSPMT